MASTETRQRSHLHLKRYVRATSVLATLNLCLTLLILREVETLQVTEDGSIYGRECGVFQDTWSMMSLPPASPFDNFLKAAGAGR